jgi:hypothetical protein
MARNLAAMVAASEAEFADGERAVARGLMKVFVAAGAVLFLGILRSGWAISVQIVALAALGAVAAILCIAISHLLPPPEPAPPFERLTPRAGPRRRFGRDPR